MTSRRREARERALALAREEATARGHPWVEPVSVYRTLRYYIVEANKGFRGGSIRVTIDRDASRIVKYWITPR